MCVRRNNEFSDWHMLYQPREYSPGKGIVGVDELREDWEMNW